MKLLELLDGRYNKQTGGKEKDMNKSKIEELQNQLDRANRQITRYRATISELNSIIDEQYMNKKKKDTWATIILFFISTLFGWHFTHSLIYSICNLNINLFRPTLLDIILYFVPLALVFWIWIKYIIDDADDFWDILIFSHFIVGKIIFTSIVLVAVMRFGIYKLAVFASAILLSNSICDYVGQLIFMSLVFVLVMTVSFLPWILSLSKVD